MPFSKRMVDCIPFRVMLLAWSNALGVAYNEDLLNGTFQKCSFAVAYRR
jgi:hypothetical protein